MVGTAIRKEVRFITSNYRNNFLIADGGRISVNGFPYVIHYIDPTHFYLGVMCYHICEFADMVERNGLNVVPLEGVVCTS